MFAVCFLPEGIEIVEAQDFSHEVEDMLAVRKR